MKTLEKIVNLSEKGQITLPMSWRSKIGTNIVRVSVGDGYILNITPVNTKQDKETGWVSIFDSGEKRPSIDEMINFLKKEKSKRATKRVKR